MADKPKFESFITPVGTAIYPHLLQPDTKFDSDGVYRTTLALDPTEAGSLIEQIEAVRDAFIEEEGWTVKDGKLMDGKKKKGTLADLFEDETDDEGEDTSRILIKAKQKAKITSGDDTFEKEVYIFDSANTKIKPKSLWTGSQVKLAGVLIPYFMATNKECGVSLRLSAVQVFELVEGGEATAENYGFAATEGGYKAETFENAADAGGDDADGDGDEF